VIKILGTVGSVLAGGAVATVTVLGLVSSQTGASGESPANANQPVVDYGTTETSLLSE
jgi:hypothetical protein